MKKSTNNYKDWHQQLPYALWGYRTSIQSSIGATPYSLVYVMEAVLPIKMGVYSLRAVLESEIPDADWLQSRYDQLCMLDEKRLKAMYHIQGYQRWHRKAFDKKVKTRDLKLGDLVLMEIRAPVQDANGKFKQNWVRPIHYQVDILWGSSKIDGLECKPFHKANQHGPTEEIPRLNWL